MIAWLGAAFLVVGFLVLLKLFRLLAMSRRVLAVSRESLEVIGSLELSEDDKERLLQRNAIRLFGYFLLITAAGAGALLLPVGVLWVAERLGWLRLEPVLALTLSPTFLIGTTLVACAALYLWPQVNRPKGEGSAARLSDELYSPTDRLLHELAFSTYPLQVALSRIEDRLLAKRLARVDVERPVFITALPRAGTTLLLECCAVTDKFATHRYRDMPFIPLPCTWGRFARAFRKDSAQRERAHGDGMMITADSPEALEEVLWMQFWPQQYRPDRIAVWPSDARHAAYRDYLANHMRKIILRPGAADGGRSPRYASKNNLNIARLPWLRRNFPNAVLLVPFRDPLQHAASLLRQHRRFLAIHEQDEFAAQYMRAIGHFDFGANLRPIDFDGWLDTATCSDRTKLGFWLEYWIAAYSHLAALDCGLSFFAYEPFCKSGEQGLHDLATVLRAADPGALARNRARLHPPRRHQVDTTGVPRSLLETAEAIHDVLLSRACNTTTPARHRQIATLKGAH